MGTIFRSALDGLKQTAKAKLDEIKNTIAEKLSNSFDGMVNNAKSAFQKVADIFIPGSGTAKTIADRVKQIFDNVKAIIRPEVRLPNVTGAINGGQIRWEATGGGQTFVAYAQGTNFVPNDQLALLHRGEAVIPKEFNQGAPYQQNDETNQLLREFMEMVNSKDFKAVISQREVGEASVNYIHRQSRIMGGSVV